MDESAAKFFEQLEVAGAPRELVALGDNLEVDTLLAAYRAGCFPWPATGDHEASLDRDARRLARDGEVPLVPGADPSKPLLPWVSPHPRPLLLPNRVVISRSLRKRLRHCGWDTTMDTAFEEVVAACAAREPTWITADMAVAYLALHRAGHAHSLEVWSGDELVGGLYGIQTGRIFCGESMFHRANDASKVAVVDLCHRSSEAGIVLIDTQDESHHMLKLGQILVHREDYIDVLHQFRDAPVAFSTARHPVARCAERQAEGRV